MGDAIIEPAGDNTIINSIRKLGDIIQTEEGKEKLGELMEKLKGLTDKFEALSEEDQLKATEQIQERVKTALSDALGGHIRNMIVHRYWLFALCVVVVLSLFAVEFQETYECVSVYHKQWYTFYFIQLTIVDIKESYKKESPVYFASKIYRSMTAKERKRAEKLKLKEERKKKSKLL